VIVHVGELGSANYDERMLRAVNCRRNIEVVTASFDLAPQLVIGTDRIATVPARLARKYADLLPIRLLPVPVDIPPIVEVLQWHRAHDRDPAHQASQPAEGRCGSARRCSEATASCWG